MSAMHQDTSSDLRVVGNKLKDILEVCISFLLQQFLFFIGNFFFCFTGTRIIFVFLLQISNTNLKTKKVVVELCNVVATRGARLAAAGILGVLKKMGRDTLREGESNSKTVIAMDGGLYEHYTEYRKCMENTLGELLGEDLSKCVSFEHFNDGSGIGAALLAASHSRYSHDEI